MARAGTSYPIARWLIVGVVAALAVMALLQAWGFAPLA